MIKRDPDCTRCKLYETTSHVCLLGAGARRARLMVIGEAPGATEERRGEPFIGDAGQLLRDMLDEADIDLDDVFFTNAVSCRPPNNKTPTKGQIKSCQYWLQKQIDDIDPDFILLLGNTALQSFTGKAGIKKMRGKPFEDDNHRVILPTFHPALILRDPSQRPLLASDLRLMASIIEQGEIPRENELNIVIVDTLDKVSQMIDELEGVVSFDIETNQLYPFKTLASDVTPTILSLGFGTAEHQFILPFHHSQSTWDDEELEDILDQIGEVLDDCKLVAHGGKFDFLWMRAVANRDWAKHFTFDTMMAHYILDENSLHGLKELAQKFLGAPNWDIDATEKSNINLPIEKLALYHAHDLFYTRKFFYYFGRQLKEDYSLVRLFKELIMPVTRLFVEIEYNGVCVDVSRFEEVERQLKKDIAGYRRELRKYGDILWSSPQQVGKLLFEDLGIPVVEKTKTGKYSTSESTLKQIDHPCVQALLKYRGAKQQLSFFIDGWKPYLHRKYDRGKWRYYIHPSFKIHGTVTGRPSCEHPNLQQVPRDSIIRSLIIAEDGWTVVDCDYSQIELRVAAELADEKAMKEAFNTGVDIHWLTAIREISRGGGLAELILDTASKHEGHEVKSYAEAVEILLQMGPDRAAELNKEWKEYRKKAKAVNFGYLFGMWWKKFKIYARDNYGVEVTDEQAEASREAYFDLYYGLPDWHKGQKYFVRANGYVRSLSGRKRRLPNAQLKHDKTRQQMAERQAINSPVQSFASDLNLMALLQLRQEFGPDIVRIFGTVHDSMLFRVKNEYLEQVVERMIEIMPHPHLLDVFEIDLSVPIVGEAEIGPWGAGVSWERWKREQAV